MPQGLVAKASTILARTWSVIQKAAGKGRLKDWVESKKLLECIRCAVNSHTKTYRYVLPTQMVAKLARGSLDCRCLQAVRGGMGAFDARTIAHKVVVPFDQANHSVLGGSPEPYVNNPLRVPEVSARYRKPQKNKTDWDNLCYVLDAVQKKSSKAFTTTMLKQVLVEVYRRLSTVRITYPTPMRVSLDRAMDLAESYLAEHSGGDRLLALSAALFVLIGRRFGLYSKVRRAKITAADRATGLLADLECVSKKGKIALGVEVKDQRLTISHVKGKMTSIRARKVSEMFFIAQQGVAPKNKKHVANLVDQEFISGHNVYITDLLSLAKVVLALVGEQGRTEFLGEVGKQLDEYKSDITHRRAWADLLREA